MDNSPTHEDQLIERLTDPESSAYNSNMSFWIGQLREWKHQSRSAEPKKFDYGIYHCCRGVYEGSKYLLTGTNPARGIAIGNAVIQELERALPFASEDLAARKSIAGLIQNVRKGVEQFQQEEANREREEF